MSNKSRKDYEAEVRSWGFSHVFTWTDGPFVESFQNPPQKVPPIIIIGKNHLCSKTCNRSKSK
ncbi:hypothetical protein F4774DRAFT_380966 [Daldinia eschscholtzii]|nr:hypothetical protein F4774DRAFT_380966 [Daldinia eschscholtzii]